MLARLTEEGEVDESEEVEQDKPEELACSQQIGFIHAPGNVYSMDSEQGYAQLAVEFSQMPPVHQCHNQMKTHTS